MKSMRFLILAVFVAAALSAGETFVRADGTVKRNDVDPNQAAEQAVKNPSTPCMGGSDDPAKSH
jgi:hypothetical protein